jgi:hypothetical protein
MRFFGLPSFTIVALLSLAACPGEVAESEGEAGAAPAVAYGDSACGLCVAEACSDTIEVCAADPECAAHLSCLLGCPIDASGDADLDCVAGCPAPTTVTGQNALTALTTCRQNGDGAACVDCGHPPAGHPLLDQSCEPPTAVNACDRCEEELCCETRCELACQGYVSCMQTCGGAAACQDGCAASHPEGVGEFARWLGCQVPLCRDHCTSLVPGPCLECGLVNCPHQFADCFSSPACYLRFLCGTRCDSAACYQACDAQYPEADALFGAFLLCVGESCIGGPCDGGGEL